MDSVKVRYIGNSYKYWFGDKDYVAEPRHVRGKGVNKVGVDWRITDRDGDTYTIAQGTLDEGLRKDWIVIS